MNSRVLRFYLNLILLNLFVQIIPNANVYAVPVKIIVHPDIQDSLSANDIRNIFLGKKTQWDNNQRIRFVLFTEETTYQSFITHYVRKTLYQYRNYWRKKVFTGTGMMPVMFNKCRQCIEYVNQTQGAISFVPENCIVPNDVKEITLD
jgi:ABC-type phosphate transport system substrate-binding protein